VRAVGSNRPRRQFETALAALIALLTLSSIAMADEWVFAPKWAMNNEEYAQKYSVPYSDDPLVRRKQIRNEMFDATFQDGAYGVYGGGSGSPLANETVGQLDIGVFKMPTAWSTLRLGANGMVVDGHGMAGGELGFRLHTPTRLAPYVGLGGVLDLSGLRFQAKQFRYNPYYYDSQGNPHPNLYKGYFPQGMAAIVPETGLSYWLTTSTRLNLGVSYYVTGKYQPNLLLVSLSLDFALQPPEKPSIPPPISDFKDTTNPYFFPDDPNIEVLQPPGPTEPLLNPERLDPNSEPTATPMPPSLIDEALPAPVSALKGFVPSPPDLLPPSIVPRAGAIPFE
jgi:hypothetical protein